MYTNNVESQYEANERMEDYLFGENGFESARFS